MKFLLDLDVPRSGGELVISLGYEVDDVKDFARRRGVASLAFCTILFILRQ